MELVEFWRARRAFVWYVAIVAAFVVMIFALSGHANFNLDVNDTAVVAPRVIPLSIPLSIAMFLTAMLASWLGQALNRENATVELSWTRPIPRSILALRFIAIDLVTLALAFVVALAAVWTIAVTVGHVAVMVDSRTGVATLLGTGVDAMWYALVLVLSSGVRGRGGAIAGMLWPVSLILIGVAQTHGGIFHDIALVLNVINPFAYLGSISRVGADGAPVPLVWPLDAGLRGAIVWLLAAAFCAAAVTIWKRREI